MSKPLRPSSRRFGRDQGSAKEASNRLTYLRNSGMIYGSTGIAVVLCRNVSFDNCFIRMAKFVDRDGSEEDAKQVYRCDLSVTRLTVQQGEQISFLTSHPA